MADANMAYDRKRKAVGILVRELEKQLLKHEGRQNSKSQDWGFVGDLEYIEEQLTGILRFIGGGKKAKEAKMKPLDRVMAMDDEEFVPRAQVAEICASCAEKMEKKGMVAVRAGIIKAALVDREMEAAVKAVRED